MNKILGNDYIHNNKTIRLVAIEEEDKKAVYWSYDNGKYDWLHISNIDNLHAIDRPQNIKEPSKKAYTAAMCEANELPSVGMEFISTEFGQDRHSIVKAITNEYIIYICADPKHVSECCMEICANNFKPIDTRTDEDKAFDKFLSDEYNSNITEFQSSQSDRDFIEGLQSAWKAAINFKSKGE